MVRFIAALDEKRGIADEHGIPWQGKVPTDVQYYHQKIEHGIILMGYGVYKELSQPYKSDHPVNYVASRDPLVELRAGFELVSDARQFIKAQAEDVWNTGGAILFQETIDLADELYITQLEGNFRCTKFFPTYQTDFKRVSQSPPVTENGITYRFEVWRRK